MPGDLRDPEQLFPFYYDSRYDPDARSTDVVSIREYIQSISRELSGYDLSKDRYDDLMVDLEVKGMLHRNMGDPSFREAIENFIKKQKMVRKVVYGFRSE